MILYDIVYNFIMDQLCVGGKEKLCREQSLDIRNYIDEITKVILLGWEFHKMMIIYDYLHKLNESPSSILIEKKERKKKKLKDKSDLTISFSAFPSFSYYTLFIFSS